MSAAPSQPRLSDHKSSALETPEWWDGVARYAVRLALSGHASPSVAGMCVRVEAAVGPRFMPPDAAVITAHARPWPEDDAAIEFVVCRVQLVPVAPAGSDGDDLALVSTGARPGTHARSRVANQRDQQATQAPAHCDLCAAPVVFAVVHWNATGPAVIATRHACVKHAIALQAAWFVTHFPACVFHATRVIAASEQRVRVAINAALAHARACVHNAAAGVRYLRHCDETHGAEHRACPPTQTGDARAECIRNGAPFE